MFTNLFKFSCFLPLLMLLCFTLYGYAHANGGAKSNSALNTVKLFTTGDVKDALNPNAFYSPFLVATDSMMVAVAGINRIENPDNIDILTKYIEIRNGWGEKAVESAGNNWKKHFAVQKTANLSGTTHAVKSLLAVAKEDKIYLLLVNYTNSYGSKGTLDLQFELVVGTVKNKEIEWKPNPSIVFNVSSDFKNKLKKRLSGDSFGGSAFLTKEGEIVFALVVDNFGQKMTALIHSKSNKTKFGFVHKDIAKDCHPYYFPWEEKIIMIPVNCHGDNKKIKESTTLGQQWNESKITFFQQHDFLKNKEDFVTVTIETKDVLLFVQPKESATDDYKEEFFLWISDGTHVGCVGIIDANFENTCHDSFFYTNNSLFLLLSKCKIRRGGQNIVNEVLLVRLKEQLDNITNTLNAWDKSDKIVLALCNDTKNLNEPCTIPLPTAGLVGFLHNTTDGVTNKTWKDEYYYSNATVTGNGTTKVDNGFSFNGTGAGAKWEVGKAPEDQPYNFIDPGFTLVATVEVTGDAGKNSILGVGLAGANKRVGVWCTAAGKWGVSGGANRTKVHKSAVNCTRDQKYYVALILNKTGFSVYVDGEQLTGLDGKARKIKKGENITHFYFGADSETLTSSKANATITNVLLYNRPFNTSEIDKLKIIKKELGGDTQTPIEKKNETQSTQSSPPPTTEDSAVRVGVNVFFFLFGVFTLLRRYVY